MYVLHYSIGRGRPSCPVKQEELQHLADAHYTSATMAEILNIPKSTIKKKLMKFGIKLRAKYTTITDPQLIQEITGLHNQYKNAGSKVGKAWS